MEGTLGSARAGSGRADPPVVAEAKGDPILPDGWAYRLGTWDWNIFDSVVVHDEYRLKDVPLGRKDVVIDVGAHVGCFSYLASKLGAGLVVAYEPGPENFSLLQRNAGLCPGVVLPRNVAVMGRLGMGRGMVRFEECSVPENTGGGGVVMVEGSCRTDDIPASGLDRIIANFGRVALLKLDCEGSEHEALANCLLLPLVGRVVGEYHGGLKAIPRILASAGFSVESVETDADAGLGLFWATRGAY